MKLKNNIENLNLSKFSLKNSEKGGERPSFIHNALISHLYELGYPHQSICSLERCGKECGLYGLRECDLDCELNDQIVPYIHRCNLRTCQVCAKRRKNITYSRFIPFFKLYEVNRQDFFQFLTISPPNYKTFEEGFKDIRKSFNKFVRRKYIKERIKAGFYVIEAKETEKGWNIHIHAVLYGRWLDYRLRGNCKDCNQNLLRWDKVLQKPRCANSKCKSYNVERFKDTKIVREWERSANKTAHIYGERVRHIFGAVNYLVKYISVNKDNFTCEKSLAKYIISTSKKKLINGFGLFFRDRKKVKKDKPIYICHKCKKQIKVKFDYIVSKAIFEDRHKPPEINLNINQFIKNDA